MSNSKTVYNDFVRANLPEYIRYDSVRNQYVTVNGKRFVTYKEAKWYTDYIIKNGSIIDRAIGFNIPQTIADFSDDTFTYSKDGNPASTTAENLLTHTRSGNAVQVADDGTLQWAGHNLLTYSEDISALPWTTTNITIDSPTQFTFDTASGYIRRSLTIPKGQYTLKVTLSGSHPGDTFNLELVDGADGSDSNVTVVTVPNEPTEFTVTADFNTATFSGNCLIGINRTVGVNSVTAGSTINIERVHFYRSDLGGMADIPLSYRGLSSSSTYLPTTSTARYLPRVDNHIWDGSSWVKRCLVEPQSTNLVTQSNAFGGAGWVRDNFGTALAPVVNATNILSPDGTNNASEIVFDVGAGTTAGDASRLLQNPLVSLSAVPHSASVWLKVPSGSRVVELSVSGSASSAKDVTVNDQWQRFDTQGTPGSAFAFSIIVRGDTTPGSTTLHVYGAQLEPSPVPTSYIPTAGAQVTRPADALSIDSTLLPYDSTAMTIAMDGEVTYADTGSQLEVTLSRWRFDGNNQVFQFIDTRDTATGLVTFRSAESGVFDDVDSSPTAYSPGINVPFNIASRHTSSDINGAVDGTALTANTTPTALPDLSATDFQIAYTGVINIKSLRILGGYGATDVELEAATVS